MQLPALSSGAHRLLHVGAAVLATFWTLSGSADGPLTSHLRLAALCYLIVAVTPRSGLHLAIVLPLITAYEPFGLGRWLGLFMYTPLFWAIYAGQAFSPARAAAFIAFGQVLVLTPWIEPFLDHFGLSHAPLLVFTFLYWLAALALLRLALSQGQTAFSIAAVVVIPVMEWLRSHLQVMLVPYHLSAHAISADSTLVQWVEATGVVGLGALICAVSALAARCLHRGLLNRTTARRQFAIVAAVVVSLHTLGAFRSYTIGHSERTVRVAAVQLDAPGSRTAAQQLETVDRLYRELAPRTDVDLVIMPETTAFRAPQDATGDVELLRFGSLISTTAAHRLETPVLVGTLVAEKLSDSRWAYRNSATLLAGGAELASRDKRLFAPLGETTLFQDIPFLDLLGVSTTPQSGRMRTGEPGGEVRLPSGLALGICICIEQMVPQLWRFRPMHARPDVLVCLGDTSILGFSQTERMQSRAARVLRAIEQRRPLIFVANGGSEALDVRGHIGDELAPDEALGIWTIQLGPPDGELTEWLRGTREELGGVPALIPVLLLLFVLCYLDERDGRHKISPVRTHD